MNNKKWQVLLHIAGCIIFLMLPMLFAPDAPESFNLLKSTPTQRNMVAYLLMIGFFYINFFILIPRFYFAKKHLKFGLYILACFIVVITLPSLILPEGNRGRKPPPERRTADNRPPINDRFPPPPPANNLRREPPGETRPQQFSFFNITQHLFIFLAVVFFSLILRISNRWKQSEKEKLNAELLYLKGQINPHFLFNTLNNIYALALEKSDNTATAVVKLSGMMRYVLLETDKDFVTLEKEIGYIKNYIELQQMRFENSVNLLFTVTGNTAGKKIAPLILIAFIENAFKHGINAEEDSSIGINIEVRADELSLLVKNNKVYIEQSTEEKSGLGIENTRSRLKLLYPGKHTLKIDDNNTTFSVLLNLNLV